jgi:hypothetical protein
VDRKYIPLEECKDGYLYRISSRNLAFGVYRAEAKGFVGIREKFGNEYLFTEFHYDTGAPFGTVFPKKELEQCTITPINEGYSDGEFFRTNQPLFDWLKEKEKQYGYED